MKLVYKATSSFVFTLFGNGHAFRSKPYLSVYPPAKREGILSAVNRLPVDVAERKSHGGARARGGMKVRRMDESKRVLVHIDVLHSLFLAQVS